MRMNCRTYLNVILTVIAVLLLILAMQQPGYVGLATPVQAQSAERDAQQRRKQMQYVSNPELAAATKEVAQANKEVAKQLGNIAAAIKDAGKAIAKGESEKN